MIAAAGFGLSSLTAAADGSVVVSSWGGSFQAAERKAIFDHFEKATGIDVVDDSGPSLVKIKTMVESGNVQWDVAEVNQGDYLALAEQGLLEEIDYSVLDEETRKQMPQTALLKYGAEGVSYSRVIGWNTKTFGENGPQSWADVWDTKKFPGARVIDAGDYPNAPFEYALLAEGVTMDKMYPLDLDRSFASLRKIRPDVVKWSTTSAMGPEALASGEADIAIVSSSRIEALKQNGAPVDYTFNQGALIKDYLVVPKGAKNKENAMKFIAFYLKADGQARLSALQPLGPSNPAAFEQISEDVAHSIPTYPKNAEKQILIDYGWWAQIDPKEKKTWREVAVARWQQFLLEN
ncbi:MAG: ABC transporter substrate-binding protein [Parvibaculaceae bacterium]